MRAVVLHRRAARYLSKMPRDRAIQVRDALREVAALDEISSHPNIKQMGGNMAGWSRLRIGSYRAILQITIIEVDEVLYVDAIGPRGDLLIRLQAQFDYQKAFHGKNPDLQMEVRAIA